MKTALTFFAILLAISSSAQTKVSGLVKDANGEPVAGANVLIKDSYDGTSTAADGKFSFITTEQGQKIVVATFVGYKSFERQVELSGKEISVEIVLQEEANLLDGVTISAGSFTAGEEKRRTILKPVDIATTAGATADIAGALNTLPGTQKVGESGRLFVRGGDGNETRTFIDGMAVLDAYGPAAPNTPSRGRFLPFMFKGTSFSTGGYSAEYGQALSSALILNSKDKAEANQTDIGILSVGGDVAHTQAWKRSSATGKIQYTDLRPYMGLIDQRVDWITPPVSIEGSTAYRQQVGRNGMFKLFGNFNNSTLSLYNHDILNPTVKQQFDLTNNYRYGNASFQQPLNDKWNLRGGLSYTFNENKILVEGLPMGESENGMHTKAVAEYSATDHFEMRFGGEVINRNYEAYQQNSTTPQNQKASFHETLGSSFAEAQLLFNKHLIAKAGARLEYNSLIQQSSVDPRFSLAYKPGGKGQFAFAYGRFRQSPKNQYVRINHLLNPEEAEHFIFNYQIMTDRRTFRVETYYKKYASLVKFNNGNAFDLNNAGSGYAKGIELFWRDSKTVKNVDYWVSYSYLDTERDYLNFPSAAVPSFASQHNFSIVYKHFISKLKTQAGVTYSYSSGRPYYNPNDVPFNSDRTPSYQDLSANIAYLPKPNLIFYFSCTNLLGRDNIFGYQYSSAPDTNGVYVSRAVRQPADRFLFVGVFITISKNKSIGQLPNL
jgi:CarboxypepD_reg-like domain/TonB-dependent Receptor Plug Domain